MRTPVCTGSSLKASGEIQSSINATDCCNRFSSVFVPATHARMDESSHSGLTTPGARMCVTTTIVPSPSSQVCCSDAGHAGAS